MEIRQINKRIPMPKIKASMPNTRYDARISVARYVTESVTSLARDASQTIVKKVSSAVFEQRKK